MPSMRDGHARFAVLALGSFTLFACATAPAPVQPAASRPSVSGFAVEKLREELQVAPWELSLSGVRGEGGVQETVTVRNLVDHPVELRAIQVVGDGARLFSLVDLPPLPTVIPAKRSLSVGLAFRPPADSEPGVERAALRFQIGKEIDDGPAVDLSALVLASSAGDAEPSLRQVVEALGFAIDTEGGALVLAAAPGASAGPAPIVFARARPSPVAINPVARFSPDGTVAFGYRPLAGAPGQPPGAAARAVGVLAAGQHQTLNPELEAEGQTSFDPGDGAFGVWINPASGPVDSADPRPGGPVARVFALRSRGGAAIPNAYLLAFGDPTRGDLQDCVFVLWNVKLQRS